MLEVWCDPDVIQIQANLNQLLACNNVFADGGGEQRVPTPAPITQLELIPGLVAHDCGYPLSQSQKSHWAKTNRSDSESRLCSHNVFWGVSRPMWRFWNTVKTTQNWRFPSPKIWLQRVFSESQWFFELRSPSLAICDFEVAAIRVTISKGLINPPKLEYGCTN